MLILLEFLKTASQIKYSWEEKLNGNAAAVHRAPLIATHPGCEKSAGKKLNLLVPFSYCNATFVIRSPQTVSLSQQHEKVFKSWKCTIPGFSVCDLLFLVQWGLMTCSNCWYPFASFQLSMRCNIVEGVLAAAYQVGKTAPRCKSYQTALLLWILITENSPALGARG